MKINRVAVCVFFFVNGFLYANWTARLPELKDFYQVSDTMLGSLLFTSALGALLAMPFAGWLTTKFSTRRVTQVAGILYCLFIPCLAFSNDLMLTSVAFFGMGFSVGALDVAMNGQAVFVERDYKRPIMSSFHAVFSIGMALGAGVGALFTKFEFTLLSHFQMMAILGVLAMLWGAFNLVPDPPKVATSAEGESSHFQLPTKAILPLGLVAFCVMTGEGAMVDWSAIFMNKVVGKDEFFSAFAVGSFGAAMTIGRLFGDYLTEQLGKHKMLIYSSLLAIIGMAIVLGYVSTVSALVGFFLVGLGLSSVVPIVFSTAGNMEGIDPSVGIAMSTSIGYAGFFVGPPLIGFLSDQIGLRLALCFVLFLFVMMLLLVISIYRKEQMKLKM